MNYFDYQEKKNPPSIVVKEQYTIPELQVISAAQAEEYLKQQQPPFEWERNYDK